jgi:hypothetical protein
MHSHHNAIITINRLNVIRLSITRLIFDLIKSKLFVITTNEEDGVERKAVEEEKIQSKRECCYIPLRKRIQKLTKVTADRQKHVF